MIETNVTGTSTACSLVRSLPIYAPLTSIYDPDGRVAEINPRLDSFKKITKEKLFVTLDFLQQKTFS